MVEAGKAKSTVLVKSESSFCFLVLEISGSEQIQIALIGFLAKVDHSRKVWPNKAIEGTRNKTNPFSPTWFSAIRNEVNVFPVPQAMISFPLSLSFKCFSVSSKASFWWGLKSLEVTLAFLPWTSFSNFSQSTGATCKL